MSDGGDHSDLDGGDSLSLGLFDHSPGTREKVEMRKAVKRPSEWLRLLCRDWALENEALVDGSDEKFAQYKPYMKGMLTSQLLCRLSIPATRDDGSTTHNHVDFWRILGIEDEFDKAYIIAQVERFCSLYNIRGLPEPSEDAIFGADLSSQDANSLAAAAAAGISVSPSGGIVGLPPYMDHATTAAAAAAAAANDPSKLSKKQVSEVSKAHRLAKDAEKALEQERRQNLKKEQKRMTQERKEQKQREREAQAMRKAHERAQREQSREERRKKKLEIRQQREKFAQEQKELALKRAAELVASNRVPIEITRGAAAAKAAASAAMVTAPAPSPEPVQMPPSKKPRSAIVVSTAADLHQIVTHSRNLWAKYNAIAKEHNQKVNWITVAKELGIHVKVREKYARMHSRAEQRGFDWGKYGHWKIKDHPEIFIEPTENERQAKMPLPPQDNANTVLVDGRKEIDNHDANSVDMEGTKEATDEAVAAAARVVDASGVSEQHVDHVVSPSDQNAATAAAVATFVHDPTANLVNEESFQQLRAEPI